MSGENLISVIVPETVTKVDPDRICLVEYSRSCKNSDDFIALLDQNGYGVCMTDNGDGIYDRSFAESYPDIYINGEDFEDRIRRESLWSIPFGSGIPDHAILSGTVGI